MEEEYTILTGWKIFMIVVAVFLTGFSVFLFSMGEGVNHSPLIFLMPISILAGAVWIILAQIRGKIIITNDCITRVNAVSTKSIAIEDIKGCSVGEKTIVIKSNLSNDANLVINSYDLYTKSDEFKQYLKDNFKDLNAIDLENDKNNFMQDSRLGATEAERTEILKKAKRVSISYNVIGAIGGFTLMFLDNTKTNIVLLMGYPIIGIMVMLFSRGLIKFLSDSKRSVLGFTMLGIFLPVFFLAIKSLFIYTISEYDHLWLPFLSISFMFFILLLLVGINRSVASVIGQAIVMFIVALIYGFGSTRQINCAFDRSAPKLVHSTIASKWIEHSKGDHYHLKINSWNADPGLKDIEVSKSTYDLYTDGNNIDVFLKVGVLNIPWYYINE